MPQAAAKLRAIGTSTAARLTVFVSAYTVVAFVLLGLLAAVAVPIHAIDALAYGEWSRLIGDEGGFRFPSISDQTYHRPLFYVLQGWLWWSTGFSDTSGRLLSLFFSIVLVASVAWLAARGRPFAVKAALAALCLVIVPDFARGVAAGLTDVPVAAMLGLTACVLWTERLGRARIPLLLACATAAALTKPTALLGLATLCAAHAVGPRARLPDRLRTGVLPLAGGTALALVYHVAQARYLDRGLFDYLTAGSTGVYSDLAAEKRVDAFFGFAWLGPELRPVVLFALAYSISRVVGLEHIRAVLVATPLAIALTIAGAIIPGDEATLPALGSIWQALGLLALAATFAAAALARPEVIPSRLWLARLLVFGLPLLAVWAWFGAYDTRLVSTAWPALLALCGLVLATCVAGAIRLNPVTAVAPLAVLVALALGNLTEIDGLGGDRWRELQQLGGDMFDHDRTRRIVLPAFADTLDLVTPALGDEGRLLSAEGQFRFFFPQRVAQTYATRCSDLRGYRAFVLLTDDGTKAYMESIGVPAEPSYWAACTSPRLVQLSDGSSGYAAFRVAG